MKKPTLPELNDEVVTRIIFGAMAISLCAICYSFAPQNIEATWTYVIRYLGYMAYVLIPMTILLFSILIHAIFEPLEEKSCWATMIRRLEVFFPLVGLLSTFLAIGMGLANLNTDQMSTQSILSIAGEICKATWGSILGVSMGMVAYVVHHDLTVESEEIEEDCLECAEECTNNPEHLGTASFASSNNDSESGPKIIVIPNNANA